MLIASDIAHVPLNSLYELMNFKIEELKALKNLYADYHDQQKDIELIQKAIEDKKIKSLAGQSQPSNIAPPLSRRII